MPSIPVILASLFFHIAVGMAEPAPTPASAPEPTQQKFRVAGPSSKFIRLQPFEVLPLGLQFGPQNLLVDETGAPYLAVEMGNVTEAVKFDGRDYPCDQACTLNVPLQRRNHVLIFEHGSSRTRLLVAWVALPLPTDKLPRLTYDRASGIKTVQDDSGYDPAVSSLILFGKGGLAEIVAPDQAPSLHLRTFSYAAAEASEWRVVVMKDKEVVTAESQRGAVPEQVEIGSKLGADPRGAYTVRIDMSYAGKFFQGQDAKVFIGDPETGNSVTNFELSATYFVAPDRTGFSTGPYLGYSLGFKINDESRLGVGAAFSVVKIASPKSLRPMLRVTTGYERQFTPKWDAQAGIGVSTGVESGFAFIAHAETARVVWDSLWGMTAVSPVVGLTHYFGDPSAIEIRLGFRARF